MVTDKKINDRRQLVLSPNRSSTWTEIKLVAGFISLITLTIGIGWALLGAWLILPFAGFEVILLVSMLYLIAKQGLRKQVLYISTNHINISSGIRSPNKQWKLKRKHTCIYHYPPQHPDDSPTIYLQDEENKVRIGEFLNKSDLQKLLLLLDQMDIIILRQHWWES